MECVGQGACSQIKPLGQLKNLREVLKMAQSYETLFTLWAAVYGVA